ncbi:MAG: hypothetical protein J6J36_08115 [Clostridia bacterium]|nr:hypothetical protein [Clostridia bacterium]MBP3708538.1 hypothetical protein [Clostridia bacterium]
MISLEQLIDLKRITVKGDNEVEINTLANKGMKYKIINDETGRFKVIDMEGFAMGDSPSIKGAVISALACGVPLREINFNGHWVPVRECLEAVK